MTDNIRELPVPMAPRRRKSTSTSTSTLSRRRTRTPILQTRWTWSCLVFLVVACMMTPVSSTIERRAVNLVAVPTETLVVDQQVVPVKINGAWQWVHQSDVELRKRQEDGGDAATTPSPTRRDDLRPTNDGGDGGGDTDDSAEEGSDGGSSSEEDESTSESSTPTSTLFGDPAADSPSPLPSPFDNNLDFNFTSNGGTSCPKYLNNLLTSDTFKSCYPLSMMLQTSKSFFDAEKNLQSIVTVLDATCKADLDFCTSYLKDEAKKMIADENCGDEYRQSQPNIMQAYLGMQSYNVMYKATCLPDPETGIYCFANAVTNQSTPANAYFYFLPMNMSLPESSNPACSQCLQDTMAIFQAATANRKQAIAMTYESAAKQVNSICGPDFIAEALAAPVEGSGSRLAANALAVFSTFVVVAVNWVL